MSAYASATRPTFCSRGRHQRFPVTNRQYADFLGLPLGKADATARLYDYDDLDARE